MNLIPFNKPFLCGKETDYIREAVASGKISGNGEFSKKCHQFFERRYSFRKCLLTTSCTDALEMAAILLDIQPGDEIIVPSYTFVSTANAFVLRGARIVFADSMESNPNIDADRIEALITSKTRAIVPVHYAGMACDMDAIMALAEKYKLFVIEDAAQAIDSYYKGRPLGGIGHMSAFSFHETKNIISGEGGMLVVNDPRFVERAEIIWEKGTNRTAFFRGEVDKYGWVDVGSSFLPSEVIAAFLFAQLESLPLIQEKRKDIWNRYRERLAPLAQRGKCRVQAVPKYATANGHLWYLLCNSVEDRVGLIEWLRSKQVHAVFHYLSLHKSPYYTDKYRGAALPFADYYSDHLVRLPLYYDLSDEQVDTICDMIFEFFN
jgi:dTDP-4-amino-4,6-dideoxygalactose transaminase